MTEPPEDLRYLTCPHRGMELRPIDGVGCACDRMVYACKIHKECLKKLPATKTREKYGKQMEGVVICATECEEWKVGVA